MLARLAPERESNPSADLISLPQPHRISLSGYGADTLIQCRAETMSITGLPFGDSRGSCFHA
jgi:hypothetical protein